MKHPYYIARYQLYFMLELNHGVGLVGSCDTSAIIRFGRLGDIPNVSLSPEIIQQIRTSEG